MPSPRIAPAPELSVNDVTVTEGNAGTVVATFTITRTGATSVASSVQWSTADGSAVAPSDYTAVGLATVNFASGETTKTVSVTVNGDDVVEANDGFTVNLSSPTNATIADGTGVGRITNDDFLGSLAINDATVTEGDSGTLLATFTITRSGPAAGAASIDWFTVNGTASAPGDYTAVAPTTVTFAPGDTTKTVSVSVNGDTAVEANETFIVRLGSPVGATVTDPSGLGRITNDDAATFSIDDTTVTESDSGTALATFTITRSGDIGGPASVMWATGNGSATAPSDYTAVTPTTVNFAAGEATKAVSVTVHGDTAIEGNETFVVRLTAPVGASLIDASGVGRITNDD